MVLAGHSERAAGQAFQANPGLIKGSVNRLITGPTSETITIDSDTAIITWLPNSDTNPFPFLPAGNVATFNNGAGVTDFVVLNRIGTSQTIQFDGTVISRIKTGSDEVAGGTLLFSSPGGIIVGNKALFDVGNLVLTTLNVATLDEDSEGPYLVPGDFQFSQSDLPPAAIVTGTGTQFTATSENSYIAMVAPRIDHGGTTDVNGSAAYLAGQQLQFTVDQGLFDIVVTTGTDNEDALVHSGSTGGPASTGGTDNHRIYIVAVPRNQAITALLSGDVGFDPAVSVAVENGAIILSAGFDVSGDDVLRTTGAGPDASFLIQDADVTSDLSGYAVADMFAGGGAGPLSFDQDVNLFADRRARLFAAAGQAVTVLGTARVSAVRSESSDPTVIDLTGGEAIASAAPGGTLAVSGSLIVDASGTGAGDGGGGGAVGDGTGGTARLIAGGGDVQVGGNVAVRANGTGADNLLSRAGDGSGGRASVESSGGGSIAVGGDLRLFADGRGGSVQPADQNAGSGSGGRAMVTTDGGSISVTGGANLFARGSGGELITPSGELAGAAGTGGIVSVSAAGGGPLTIDGAVAIDVRGEGGGGALGGVGGDGRGGTVTLSADGASIDLAATGVQAGGFGGAGGAGGPGGAGGVGGGGRGGDIDLSAGPAATLTIDDLQAEANGEGGAGGIGGVHDVAGGSGGGGGDASGGTVEVGSGGGDLLVTGPAGIELAARALGGVGAAGGEGFGAAATGGDGGTGGDAIGGDARLVASGGSIDAGPVAVAAGASGGDGGAGGVAGGTGGAGGAGGDAASGGARMLSLGGTITVGDAAVTANAGGGAGGEGSNGGAGGDGGDAAAGIDEAAFTRGAYVSAEGGDLKVASAVIQATATGGGGGDGAGGGDGGDGSGGGARFESLAGTLRASGLVALAANGFGGDGGTALQAATAGGDGGSGSGGRILLSTQGSPAAAVDAQDVQLFASGIGGDGGAGAFGAASGGDGGDGGTGTGGDADILAGRGTLSAGDARLGANGFGGAGGAGGDGDPGSGQGGDGGDGAIGRGGSVAVSAGSAAATLGDVELVASGTGGTGGSGGPASVAGAGGADAGDFGGQARIESSLAAAGDPAGSLTAGAVSLRVEGDAGGRIELLTRFSPATFDSLDVFGRGILLASFSAEDSVLRVDGPALFDIGGDLFLFTTGSGRIDVGGELRLTASGSIIAERSPDEVPATSAIDAGAFIASAGADYLGAGATVGSAGAIDISAIGIVEGGNLDADAAIDVDGAAIDITSAIAGGDIDLTSTGDILVGTAVAGDDFLADAGGSFTATSVTANVGSDILIDAVGSLRLDNGEASGLIRLTSSGAGVASAGLLQAGTSLVVQAAGGIDLAEAEADGAISLTAGGDIAAGRLAGGGSIAGTAGGRIDATDLNAGQNILLDAGAAVDVGTAAAGRDIDLAGASVALADGSAGRDIRLAAGGAIDVDLAEAGDDFHADAGGAFTGGDVTVTGLGPDSEAGSGALAGTGNLLVEAGGDLRLDAAVAAGRLELDSLGGGIFSDGALSADRIAADAASGIALTTLTAAGNIDLATANGDISGADFDAGGTMTFDAAGAISVTGAEAGRNILLDAGAAVDVGTAAAGRDIDLAGASVALADGSAGRDIRLAAGGAIDVDLAEAGDDFHADASGAFTGGEVTVTGLGPDSEAGSGAFAGTGNLLVEAGGDLRLDDAVAAGRLELDSLGGGIFSDGALSADRIAADAASGIALTALTAAGNINLATANGGISGAAFDAGRSIDLDAASAIVVTSVEARADIAADAARVDIDSATAGRDITLVAGSNILVGLAEAGDDFHATAGAGFSADGVVATGLGPDSEKGAGALAASGNINVTAAGDLRLDDGTAAAAITLSSDGNLFSDGLLSAGTDLQAAAKLDLDIDDARAGGVLNLAADGDVDAGDLSGGTLIFVGSRGGVTVASADSDGPISIEAEGDVTAGALSAGGFIGVEAGGAADIGAADAVRFISVTAAGAADLGMLSAGQDIMADASSIAVQNATAARDVTLDSGGGIAIGSVQAGDDFRSTSGGDFAGGTAVTTGLGADSEGDGSNIAIDAAGELRLDNGDAAGRIGLAADSGSILSDGTLTAAGLDVTAGSDLSLADVAVADDLVLSTPNGAISGNNFASQGGIALTASGPVVLGAADAADGLAVAATSIDLASAAAGGDIALTSAGGLIVGPAAAGGDFDAQAGGDATFAAIDAGSANVDLLGAATFTGAVLADTVSVGAADIDMAAAGSLGGADTGLVLLSPLAGGPQTVLGGAIDGPGFTLSDAEAGRISAAVLRIEAPAAAAGGADLLVRDLTLDGGRVGRLELSVGGIARIEGGLRLTGAGAAHAIAIAADDRLEIVAPTGGIRLLDGGGLPAGTLTLRANAIWSASALLIDRLTADPDFAGRDVLLRTNVGPFTPRGQVEADGIALLVRDSLFVQNSGRPTDLAGLTVGAGGLTLTPTGAAPLSVYAFGRRIDPAGGFVTNTTFFGEVRFEPGTAGFADPAQFNLCFINSGICNAPDAPFADGSDRIRGPFDVPGPAEIRDELIDASFAAEPLIDEPVTSGADTIGWVCEADDDRDCPREPRDD